MHENNFSEKKNDFRKTPEFFQKKMKGLNEEIKKVRQELENAKYQRNLAIQDIEKEKVRRFVKEIKGGIWKKKRKEWLSWKHLSKNTGGSLRQCTQWILFQKSKQKVL
jgi:hypothetical protein